MLGFLKRLWERFSGSKKKVDQGKKMISEAYQKHKETFIREGLSQDFTEKLIVPGETEKKMTLDDLIKLEDEMIAKGFRPIVSLAEIKKKKEEK